MITKYTPGPWTVESVEYGEQVTDDLCILAAPPSFRDVAAIARCFQGDRIKDMEQANAHLISAAPTMLEALHAAKHHIEDDAVLQQVFAAIELAGYKP